MELFRHGLTPQREHLVRNTRQGIRDQTLLTSDLLVFLLHLREIHFDPAFSEWGSSVAHIRRNRGALWKRAVDIWATHIYFAGNWDDLPLDKLPVHLFEMFFWVLDYLSDWQIEEDFGIYFPGGLKREEAKETLRHLYGVPKQGRISDERSGFVLLVNKETSDPRDLAFVRQLIRLCDFDALNMTPVSMVDYVELFQRALRQLGIGAWRLDADEQLYLQLHFLACLHNTIIDLDYNLLGSVPGKESEKYTAMVSASAMGKNLSLDVAFYYYNERGHLDQVDLESGDERFPNLTYPVITTDLPEGEYLLESDENVAACLYNHPVEVILHRGQPRLIAMERNRCVFPVTPDRTKPPRPGYQFRSIPE
jgi:hypothetical protein